MVSTRWKFWMESVLEKKSISIWKAKSVPISITNMEAEPPALVHLFVLETVDRFTPVKWASLPPALESWEEKGNPFPSQSLKLTSPVDPDRFIRFLNPHPNDRFDRSQKPRSRAQLIRLTGFFSKFGEHLTSLILTSVTLSPETFIGILENTPKLKALNLIRVLFRGKLANCAQLPALQHLHHLRVFYVKIMLKKADAIDFDLPSNIDKKIKLYNWILSPFQQQLLTLDTDSQSGIATAANFANLERLFISHVQTYHIDDPRFLQPKLFLYPRLKSLFLTGEEIRFNRDIDIMKWFKHNIEPLAETLSELHLDLSRKWIEDGPLFQLSTKLTHSQNKTDKVVFPEMKTFVITFPHCPEEVEVIKTLIKGFPNLEALTFLERKFWIPDAKNILEREGYAKVCPKLKNIMIRRF
ncbi:unnamed protein product [Orchesella dallaii]|uniref:Uncharacterized protein n=1 Tax=Orchesella dallaii TaxID=48710 RepID=A0ABP1RJW2_9HEXA